MRGRDHTDIAHKLLFCVPDYTPRNLAKSEFNRTRRRSESARLAQLCGSGFGWVELQFETTRRTRRRRPQIKPTDSIAPRKTSLKMDTVKAFPATEILLTKYHKCLTYIIDYIYH